MKLITDTCSAMKLLAFGDKLFKDGAVPLGKLTFHSRVYRETNQWGKEKKEKYKHEIALLKQIGNKHANLSVPRKQFEAHEQIVKVTRDAYNLSVGQGDIEQLVSALHHELAIITDDGHFGELAGYMEVVGYDAEDIILEAKKHGTIVGTDIEDAKKIWVKNGEKRSGKV